MIEEEDIEENSHSATEEEGGTGLYNFIDNFCDEDWRKDIQVQ